MTRTASRSALRLRPVGEQIHSLERMVQAFRPDHAMSYASTHAMRIPAGYAGYVAVPMINNFGLLRIPAANEAWGKKTGWTLHTSVPGLRGPYSRFRADDFVIADRTLEAFTRLDVQQAVLNDRFDENRLRVFPVRFSEDPEPVLADDEFHLDLGSLIWLLASHGKWRSPETGLLLRCLGDQHGSYASMHVGYQNLERVLSMHHGPRTDGIVVIGRTPV